MHIYIYTHTYIHKSFLRAESRVAASATRVAVTQRQADIDMFMYVCSCIHTYIHT